MLMGSDEILELVLSVHHVLREGTLRTDDTVDGSVEGLN